jgi:hypothetical protein
MVAASLDEVAKGKEGASRFESLSEEKRKEIGQQGQELHKSRELRQSLEAKQAATPLSDNSEKPSAKFDKAPDKSEKPAVKSDKPTEKSQRPSDKSEKPVEKSGKPTERSTGEKLKMPKSPVVGPRSDKLGKDEMPPKAHEAPKPDPNVEPKLRKPADKPGPPKATPNVKKSDVKPESPKAEPKERPKGEKKDGKDKP